METQKEERLCKGCQTPVTGRRNKLFCSSQCKSNHYNTSNRDPTSSVVRGNKLLKSNHATLKKLITYGGNWERVPKAVLDYEEYHFDVFTSQSRGLMTGSSIRWVYSLGLEMNVGRDSYHFHFTPPESP